MKDMKKYLLHLGCMILVALALGGCEDKSVSKSFIGKWDTINNKEKSFQKIIEIKEGNTFVETWTVFDDDGNLLGELEIKGRCELTATEGVANQHALCFIYDLESLSDPDGILEAMEQEDYFKKENDSYESAKRRGKVYGVQNAHVSGSRLFFNGGEWKLIDEDMEKVLEGAN